MKNLRDLYDLTGKIAIVTGGRGLYGASISTGLCEMGATVVIASRNVEKCEELAGELREQGYNACGMALDLSDDASIKALVKNVVEKFGKIDVLVNNAVDRRNIVGMSAATREKLTASAETNLNGQLLLSQAVLEYMVPAKSGSIINVSSMAAYDALSRVMGYAIAKEGVNALTKWLAQEMAIKYSEKIRVNAIAPGFFIGEQNRRALINEDGTLTERSHKVIAKTPMRRFGDISELNGIVRFLCSDEASFVTGTIIPVDGGFSSFSGV